MYSVPVMAIEPLTNAEVRKMTEREAAKAALAAWDLAVMRTREFMDASVQFGSDEYRSRLSACARSNAYAVDLLSPMTGSYSDANTTGWGF